MGCSIACQKNPRLAWRCTKNTSAKVHDPYGSRSTTKAHRPAPTFLLRGVFYLPPRLDGGMFQAARLKPQLDTFWE